VREKDDKAHKEEDGVLAEDEDRAINSIPLSIYAKYFFSGRRFSGMSVRPLIVSSVILSVFTGLFTNVWLSFWVDHKFDLSDGFCIGIYVMFNFLDVLFVLCQLGIMGCVTARASKVFEYDCRF
jgi:hypothetical protein